MAQQNGVVPMTKKIIELNAEYVLEFVAFERKQMAKSQPHNGAAPVHQKKKCLKYHIDH